MHNLRAKGLTEGITLTSKDEDRRGESYETEWTINPLLLEGSGYSEYKGYEGQVQAVENQARALERTSEDINGAVAQLQERASRDVES